MQKLHRLGVSESWYWEPKMKRFIQVNVILSGESGRWDDAWCGCTSTFPCEFQDWCIVFLLSEVKFIRKPTRNPPPGSQYMKHQQWFVKQCAKWSIPIESMYYILVKIWNTRPEKWSQNLGIKFHADTFVFVVHFQTWLCKLKTCLAIFDSCPGILFNKEEAPIK